MIPPELQPTENDLTALNPFDLARNGDTKSLLSLINDGLDVNVQDHSGYSILMLASYNGRLETTQALLDLGAEADLRNSRGQTPLGGACYKGNIEIVKLLVEFGADVNANNGFENSRSVVLFVSHFVVFETIYFNINGAIFYLIRRFMVIMPESTLGMNSNLWDKN